MQPVIGDPVQHLLFQLYNQYGWGTLDSVESTVLGPAITSMLDKDDNISDQEPTALQNSFFETAGFYFHENYAKEGKIIIYDDHIRTAGLKYYELIGKFIGKCRSSCITMVDEIVLWHQLGHWITHWMRGKDGSRWNTRSYRCDDQTRDVFESLAQAFVEFAILQIESNEKRNDYCMGFNFLLRNQASCYYKFQELIRYPDFSWDKMLGGIVMLRILGEPEEVTFDYLLKNLIKI